MTNLLKVLSQIDEGDMQSLECSIPASLLKDLNVQEDGQVDLDTLLKICHRVKRAEVLKERSSGIKQDDREQIYGLIYDTSKAKDFKPNQK